MSDWVKTEDGWIQSSGNSSSGTDLAGTKAEFDAIKDSLPDGSAFDTTDEEGESLFKIKEYLVTTTANSYIAPFSAMGILNLSNDIEEYGNPLSILIATKNESGASSDIGTLTFAPASSNVFLYSNKSGREFYLRVTFAKLSIQS